MGSRPFHKGRAKTGGRAKGVPNKVTLDAKAICRALVEDPVYQTRLRMRLINGTAGPLEAVVWYYAFGKPATAVDLTGTFDHVAYLAKKSAPRAD